MRLLHSNDEPMTTSEQTRVTRENSFGWLIQRVARQVETEMSERLRQLDISIPQFAVLMTVLETPGLSQAAIGEGFAMPAYAVSRALDTLQDQGLIVRRGAEGSRRAHEIHPTSKGLELAPQLRQAVVDVNASFTGRLDPDEAATLVKVLRDLLV